MAETNKLRRYIITFASCLVILACTAFAIFLAFAFYIGSADAPPEIPCTVGEEVFQATEQRLSNYQHMISEIDTNSEFLMVEQENTVILNERIGGLMGEAKHLWGSRLPFEEIVARYAQVLEEELHWSHRESNMGHSNWQEPFSPVHEFFYRVDKNNSFDHYVTVSIHFWTSPPADVISSEYRTYYQVRYDYSQNPCSIIN